MLAFHTRRTALKHAVMPPEGQSGSGAVISAFGIVVVDADFDVAEVDGANVKACGEFDAVEEGEQGSEQFEEIELIEFVGVDHHVGDGVKVRVARFGREVR